MNKAQKCKTRPIVFDTQCPPPLSPEQEAIRRRLLIEETMTIIEHCPVCGKPGYNVSAKPEILLYPKGISKISAINISITRPCKHAGREFSIGY